MGSNLKIGLRNRKATTLTEVVIGAALASVIMVTVWGLFSLSHRMFHSTRKRLVSLQGAFLLLERFNMDLSSIIVSSDSETNVSGDNKAFSFSYYDADESDLGSQNPKMVLRTMAYSYDDGSANFLRKDGNSSVRAFRDAQFEVILYAIPDKQTPLRPSDEHVTFRITCAASEDIEVNRGKSDQDAGRRDKQVVTLISTAGFSQKASEVAFPWWVPNKYPEIEN